MGTCGGILILLCCLLGGARAGDGVTTGSAALAAFNIWFTARGGRWGTGIAPEAVSSPCARLAGQSNFRVVSRLRVPKESVRCGGLSVRAWRLALGAWALTPPPPQVIVSVPHSLLFLPAPLEVCTACDPLERLALRLLQEREKGASSAWAPYLAILPAEPESGVALAPADAELLHGTYAGRLVASVRARAARFTSHVRSATHAHDYKDEALRWAFGVVVSRSIVVGAGAGGDGGDTPYDTPFLAPGADLLNHSPLAKVGWTMSLKTVGEVMLPTTTSPPKGSKNTLPLPPTSSRAFAVVSLAPLRAGAEAFNSYHDAAGDAHLLAHYGFVIGGNAFDGVALRIPGAARSAGEGEGEGWAGALGGALRAANSALVAHARGAREKGLVTDSEADAAVALLPGVAHAAPAALNALNVTVLLHAAGHAPPPKALLNVARLAVLDAPALRAINDALAEPWLRKGGSPSMAEMGAVQATRVREALTAALLGAAAAAPEAANVLPPPTPREGGVDPRTPSLQEPH